MLEPLELDRGVEVGSDAVVADLVLARLHVGLEAVAVAPAADHRQLAGVAVVLPHLQVHEAVEAVDQARPAAERGDELVGTLGRDPQAREGDVHDAEPTPADDRSAWGACAAPARPGRRSPQAGWSAARGGG